jgi:ATP-dependent exoDNAse (exonuclease V) beta subunit/ERCC4-related helicase
VSQAITFVSASAGSGKTWRVVDEVLRALDDGSLRPEGLIATTFSRRAAESLRTRLRGALLAQGRVEDALALDDARIGTVHGLCAEIVRQHSLELGLRTDLQVVDDETTTAMLRALLGEIVPVESLDAADALRTRLVDFDLIETAAAVVRAGRENDLDAEALRTSARRSVEALVQTLGPAAPDGALEAALDRCLRRCPDDAPYVDAIDSLRRARDANTLPSWETLRAVAATDLGAVHEPWLHPLRAAAATHLTHPRLCADLAEAITLTFDLAARALTPFAERRRAAGVLDYLDQESLALAVLRDPSRAAALGAALVVVDEFQDTSPMQLALFAALAAAAPRSLWVGDVKQAIYGFRGSDPALVRDAVRAALHASAPETLGRSWRSRPELVALVNGLFAPVFASQGIPPEQVCLDAVAHEDPALGAPVERWNLQATCTRDEALAIARGVRELLEDSRVSVRDSQTGGLRAPTPRDVAVLCRTNARCRDVARALDEVGLVPDLPRPGLANRPETRLALAAVALLLDPDDRLAMATWARLVADAPDDDAWLQSALAEPSALGDLPTVATLRAALQGAPPGDALVCLDCALEAGEIRARVGRWDDGAFRLANLDALRAHAVRWRAAQLAAARGVSASEWITALRDDARRGNDAQSARTGEAVEVLTWHGSKGLEWPIVVLVDLEREVTDTVVGMHPARDEGALNLDAPLAGRWLRALPSPWARAHDDDFAAGVLAGDHASQSLRDRAAEERVRLLYVAFTRARDRMVFAARPGRLLAGPLRSLQRHGTPLLQEPRMGVGRWLRRSFPVTERSLPATLPSALVARAAVEVPAGVSPRTSHAPRFVRPSDLAGAGVVRRVHRVGPPRFLRGAVDPRALGDLWHAWLAGAVVRAPDETVARAFLDATPVGDALSPDALVGAADGFTRFLAREFPEATAHAELPVTRALPGGSTLHGVIDLALVAPDGVVVVDHKSHFGADRHARAAEHHGQLVAYGEALAQALGVPLRGLWIHLPMAGEMVEIAAAAEGAATEGWTMEEGLKSTDYHAKYWAHTLQLQRPQDDVSGISRSLGSARVDLNPHQIDAALFALRSPFSKGVLLADEVGLGKTIEAGIVLAQKWAEQKRKILLVAPATLRKQWQTELATKFYLPSVILETKTFNDAKKNGRPRPFERDDAVVIVSYEFAYTRADEIRRVDWSLVVMDEAHRLRSIYKNTRKARAIVDALQGRRKVMLTATPLQNSLLEMYGLVSILDPDVFGSLDAFNAQYVKQEDPEARNGLLRDRIQHVCHRTLRRQVTEYVPFTRREPLTLEFTPSEAEESLREQVTAYLQQTVLVALPSRQRKLIQMILWKLLASSSRAIAATLEKFVGRLSALQKGAGDVADLAESVAENYDALPETAEEWDDEDGESPTVQAAFGANDPAVSKELDDLKRAITLAASIGEDAKTQKLLEGLQRAFTDMGAKGAPRKAVIFTESVKTQEYLVEWLSKQGFAGRIVVMNGSNNDPRSREIYNGWKSRHAANWSSVSSGSRAADMKAAIVEEFRSDRAELFIATESAAEGVNLQFCAIVVNYDLPWNPQRVEQRIGRCHRYGQAHDVLVLNFINNKNEADQRVYQLLDEKFHLFKGVFGATDEVLGALENGVDIEQAIADIVQRCRTGQEIREAFAALQAEVDEKLRAAMADTRKKVLDHLDSEVQERLRVHHDRAQESLDTQSRTLWSLCQHALRGVATFDANEPRFTLARDGAEARYHLRWPRAEELGDEFLRPQSDFAESLVRQVLARETPVRGVRFTYQPRASALAPWRGQRGWLRITHYETETVDRKEAALIVSALDDAGATLPEDLATRLFSLDASVDDAATGDPPKALDALEKERCRFVQEDLGRRSQRYLDEEELKLDARVEDIRLSLESEVKSLDKEAATLKKASKQAKTLDEKIDLQKKMRRVEDARDAKHRQLYEELGRYRRDRDDYIQRIERQLKTRPETITAVFTLRWTLV